ncbi:MAG: hypothetical protein MUC96_08810 [Myxococcaceae bacterium]|jgi:hypothetical protein|nr:hypothetical protein [Myxococcaceae bacterium]
MRRLLAVVSSALLAGCLTPLSASLKPTDRPLSLEAPADRARLVFVRPARFTGSAVSAFFVDAASQRVLGKSVDQTMFAVDVEPGVHVVCPVPVFDQALARMGPQTTPSLVTALPPTRLTVEAGRTYLLWVSVQWGPRVEALPVRPDSPAERDLRLAMVRARPVELAPKLDDLVVDELPAWLDQCRRSFDADVRLTAEPLDGRLTSGVPPSL